MICANPAYSNAVTPNPRFEGTAGKHSLPVPRPLRGRAAPQAIRYAARPLLTHVSLFETFV